MVGETCDVNESLKLTTELYSDLIVVCKSWRIEDTDAGCQVYILSTLTVAQVLLVLLTDYQGTSVRLSLSELWV